MEFLSHNPDIVELHEVFPDSTKVDKADVRANQVNKVADSMTGLKIPQSPAPKNVQILHHIPVSHVDILDQIGRKYSGQNAKGNLAPQ